MTAGDRRNIAPASSSVRLIVGGAIFVCVITVVAVVIVAAMQPPNALQVIGTILGVTTPVTLGLLGAGLNGMSASIDGRMTQLLQVTAEKERMTGMVDGLSVNPNVPLTEADLRSPRDG